MQRDDLTVLISGAGIAGSTLAALLGRAGHRATVVERDQGVRSSVHNEPGTAVALHPGAGSRASPSCFDPQPGLIIATSTRGDSC